MSDSSTKKGDNSTNSRGNADASIISTSADAFNSAVLNSNFDKRSEGSGSREKDDTNDHTDSDGNGNDNENNDDICKKNDDKKHNNDGAVNDNVDDYKTANHIRNDDIKSAVGKDSVIDDKNKNNNNNNNRNKSTTQNGNKKENTENAEKEYKLNDINYSATLSSGLLLNNTSHPRTLEPNSTLMVVKKSMMDQPPKLFFSVCQALGAVCYVFLAELVREKLRCLEWKMKKTQNENICMDESTKRNEQNVIKEEKQEIDEGDLYNGVCVYGCRSEERSLSCVRQITLILVAVLRHGVVKVKK